MFPGFSLFRNETTRLISFNFGLPRLNLFFISFLNSLNSISDFNSELSVQICEICVTKSPLFSANATSNNLNIESWHSGFSDAILIVLDSFLGFSRRKQNLRYNQKFSSPIIEDGPPDESISLRRFLISVLLTEYSDATSEVPMAFRSWMDILRGHQTTH